MQGSLMQLVARGAQDVYLTGNPTITFFKVVYRRHTNFSIQQVEYNFTGNINFGNKLSCRISRDSDLIHSMFLKINLPEIDPERANFAWVRRLGHAIINEIDLEIGGTIIDRQYGIWLDIWYELARQGDHEVGYSRMIGDIDNLTSYNQNIKPEVELFIPLNFWFNKFVGLSIPMIALQYHDVRVNLRLEDAEKLAVRDSDFDLEKLSIIDITLLVDNIYLDTEERRRFAQVGHEYLIDQVQYLGDQFANRIRTTYNLDFNHPTKELAWVMTNGLFTSGNKFIYYTNGVWDATEAAKIILEKSISIADNPENIIGGTWTQISPNTSQTVGTLSIRNNNPEFIYVNPNSLSIGTIGITNKIIADITVELDGTIIFENVETTLSILELSIPVSLMTDTRVSPNDPIVYQFGNYGSKLDYTGNPISRALLKFNGHDRFDEMDGDYFNYNQPEKYHSNTPREGVNVYSFSIYPEEYQPAGTANLSRIDSTTLTLTYKNPYSDYPTVNFLNDDNIVHIYALNYNILRVMSGLAGLAYSTT